MRDRDRFVGALTVVSVLYFLAGTLGLSFAPDNANVSAVWPPAGIAVAALLVLGLRAWPAVAIGAFLTNLSASPEIVPSIAIAAGNTLESVAAAVLATRFARGRHAFERGSDIFRFTAVAALLAPIIAATIGTATLRISGTGPDMDAWHVWLTWWLGDATGIVLFAPMCVLWTERQAPARAGRREAVALGISLAAVLFVVFGTSALALSDLPIAVLMLPLLLWAAFRFNTQTTATLGVTLSVIAVYRIEHQLGPLALVVPSLLVAQPLVAVISLLMLSVAAEVSVRRRVEGELRLLNETLERRVTERTSELTRVHDRLVEAQAVAHVGSWEWDVPADALWWSDELCRIFGVTQPPASYKAFLALVHVDDRERIDAAVRNAASTNQPFSFEHRIVRSDGHIRVLHSEGRVEIDAAGQPSRFAGIGHDITERKQAEEERVQLIHEQAKLREAEETNRAKDAFLATLSHELRTPLNAALGWAHILREQREDLRETRAVQAIYRNLLIQSRLVSDILDISRIAKGELPLEPEIVDMTPVFEAALDMVREAAAAKNVSIDIRTAGSPTVTGDARRLQQVAWNLLSNAVKFAAERGRVTVSILERPETVECSVEDDGPGIAPEFLPHVFEQFRQADSSVTREHGGLGLGLAISQHIVECHQGTIVAANRPKGGAVFAVQLPRAATFPAPSEASRPRFHPTAGR